MSNLLWIVIGFFAALIFLNFYNGRKAKSQTDNQFLSRKLRNAQIAHVILLAAISLGTGYFFVATLSQFSEYWFMSLGSFAFLAFFGYCLFVNLRRGKHPVAVGLQTNPSELQTMEFQTFSLAGARLFGLARFHTQHSLLFIWLFHSLEMDKLTQVLLSRAPHLLSGDQK